jgi:hypothetical protein
MNHVVKAFVVIAMAGIALSGCSDKKDMPSASKAEAVQPVAPAIQVLNWGPRATAARMGFSVQKNGNSAIWFEARGIGNADMVEVWFADRKLDGMAIKPGEGGSAEVPAELLAKPGKYPVYLVTKPEGTRVELGVFEVTEK